MPNAFPVLSAFRSTVPLLSAALLFILLLSARDTNAGTMRFVYYDDYRPRSWQEGGKMKGILIDVIDEAIGRRLGISVSHTGYPWARAQKIVETGRADAFVTIPTPSRRAYTVVGREPVLVFSLNLIVSKDNPRIKDLEQVEAIAGLKGFRIVDYIGNGWANKALADLDVQWLPGVDNVLRFVMDSRADVVVASNRTVHMMKKKGYQSRLRVLSNTISSVAFHVCIGKHSAYARSIDDIDRVIREMRDDGTIERIEQSYYDQEGQ